MVSLMSMPLLGRLGSEDRRGVTPATVVLWTLWWCEMVIDQKAHVAEKGRLV